MSDINDLLARLKSGNTPSASSPSASMHHPQPQTVGYHPPYVTSATASPSVERSGMFSPSISGNASVRGTTDSPAGDRTANLLNLLKFNQPGGNAGQRAVSANVTPSSISDLLGNRQTSSSTQQTNTNTMPAAAAGAGTQDLLLKLLNRPQATQGENSQTSMEAAPVEIMAVSNLTTSHHDTTTAPSAPPAAQSMPPLHQHSEPVRGKSPFKAVNPFEQLAASLPSRSKTPEVRAIQQKLPITLKTESPAPSPMPDGRSKIEALLGIGADSARPTGGAQDVKQAAADIKAELFNTDSRTAIETGMPAAMAKGFEDKINELAGGPVADSWEAAEAAESKAEASRGVRVYGFPMKPFLTINVKNLPTATPVRDDIVMKIASLKREFDQIDRTLASATTNFIVYSMTKTGGVRVIRQEDGTNKQVFRGSENQIFNLSISGASGSGPFGAETVLGTGVNGNVYWTSIPNSADFADEDLDRRGFSFPPLPQADENTSGSQLKTRAKLSNKHPDFFAVGRGKSIHIIWPTVALQPEYTNKDTRVVNTAKYLEDRCLKIATGKAGKDFSFSADDTVIVSLDKAGRIKFWDVRDHIDPSNGIPSNKCNVTVNTPIMVMNTTSSSEKSWATSVVFADKERSISRCQVMRYLLVGSKQNHTLHLWDLVLNKVVQEVNFPHENETDPICSIVYHAKSGLIVVGHPTRNSVFLIHLSLPRHNIPAGLSQAQFIKRLAMKDATLPKPESTAIMSGARELSLSSIGQLLSLDVVDVSSNTSVPEVEDKSLFEIYIMHTRGVTALAPKNRDLGWNADSKVLYPVDAAAERIISIGDLRQPDQSEPAPTPKQSSSTAEIPRVPSPSKKADKVAPAAPVPRVQTPPTSVPNPVSAASASNPVVEDLPPKSTSSAAKTGTSQSAQTAAVAQTNGNTKSAQPRAVPPASNNSTTPASMPTLGTSAPSDISGSTLDASALAETMSRALASTLSDVLSKVLGDLFENLYRRLDDDKRVNEAAGSAKQDAVLRLVSSTLTDNVEKSLNRIISSTIEKSVLPALSSTVSAAVERKVGDAVALQLQSSLSKDLQSALTAPIASAMQDPKVVRTLNDQLTSKITTHVESVFTTTLNQTITPAFQKLAATSANQMTVEMEKRVGLQVQELNMQRQADGAKIDKLTKLTTELVDSVRAMTGMLADSQKEIMGLQAQLAEQLAATSVRSPVVPARPSDSEVNALEDCWTDGRREEGTIRWLQSTRRVELFDLFFVKCDPAYLTSVNPIVAMSVAACITESMSTHLAERVAWLNAALRAVHDTQDPDTVQNAPKVMDTVIQRLSNEYMALIERDPSNELLPSFHGLVRQARDLKGYAMLMLSR